MSYNLKRWGISWNGPTSPLATPMPDGYWTPWHEAQARLEKLESVVGDPYQAGYLAGLEAAKGKVNGKFAEAIDSYHKTCSMYDDGLSDGFDQAEDAIDQLIKEAR